MKLVASAALDRIGANRGRSECRNWTVPKLTHPSARLFIESAPSYRGCPIVTTERAGCREFADRSMGLVVGPGSRVCVGAAGWVRATSNSVYGAPTEQPLCIDRELS